MRPAILVLGALIGLLGVPSYFSRQLSGGSGALMPTTWEYFILPGIMTAIGLTLIVAGMKLKVKHRQQSDDVQHSINHFR